jgi:hypothetical protein
MFQRRIREMTNDNHKPHKLPEKSVLYDRLMPAIFIVLGLVTLLMIGFAAGIITGVIAWR